MDDVNGQWALVELLGHRTLPGFVEVVELAGAKFFRVRVPRLTAVTRRPDLTAPRIEQLCSPGSIYAITPTTETAIADLLAREGAYLPRMLPPPGSPERPEGIDADSSTGGPDDGAGDPVPAAANAGEGPVAASSDLPW